MADILIGPEYEEMRGKSIHRREMLDISSEPITRKRHTRSATLKILTKYWKLYCRYSNLVGVKYIRRGTVCGRVLRFCGYVCVLLQTFNFMYHTYQAYANAPIVTSQITDMYLLEDLHFPGVAICSVNRISRRSAMELATRMFNANISTLSAKKIFDHIVSLGDLYPSLIMIDKSYSTIQTLLSKFYNNGYDITDIMESLTPKCSDMLLRCKISNVFQDCSKMFVLTKTSSGFCCTFNYYDRPEDRAKSENRTNMQKIHTVVHTGKYFGLSVSMDPLIDDYAYTILPIVGWKVMIFDPVDYPDPYSGGVYEVLVGPLAEQSAQLYAGEIHSADVLRTYPLEKRRCIFRGERTLLHDTYSYNKCITSCKMDDIWRACKCIPFYYPRFGFTENSKRTCNVQDIDCLARYVGTNFEFVPYEDEELMKLIGNNTPTLRCNCYPECNDITNHIAIKSSVVEPGYTNTPLFPGINVTDQSVLHVYFSETGRLYLKQDEIYRWYEYLSDAGGLCGLVIGFSMVSVAEIIYFFILFLLEICGFPTEVADEKKNSNKKIMVRPIYCKEFYPRPASEKRIYRRNNVRY